MSSSSTAGIPQVSYVVRVQGLASTVGQRLNGHVGRVKQFDISNGNDTTERLPVWIDGQPEPMALQRKNILPLRPTEREYRDPFSFVDLGSGVGRTNILSDTFQAVVHVKPSPAILKKQILVASRDESPLFFGLLNVITKALQDYENCSNKNRPILIQCTDLNLAQAINLEATKANNSSLKSNDDASANGMADGIVVSIDESANAMWGQDWLGLKKQLNAVPKRIVMAKYSPHRVEPKDFARNDRSGANRLAAVKHGTFHIYPCHYEQYRDALEVRFGTKGKSWNESWLDYGVSETMQYVKNVKLLKQVDKRLKDPQVLAQVDPQAFWSAIHHYDAFMAALKSTSLGTDSDDIVKQWDSLSSGIKIAKSTIRKLQEPMGVTLLPGNSGKWPDITNEEQLARTSYTSFHAGLIVMSWHCLPGTVDFLPMYKRTRVEEDINAILRAFQRGRENNEAWKEKRRFMCVLCFGLPTNALEVCANCGKTTGLMLCARCECVSYCGSSCQKSFHKQHKSTCRKIADTNLERLLGSPIIFRASNNR